jgi:hypothetical protein
MTLNHLSFFIIAAIVIFWLLFVIKITILRYFKLRRAADESEKGRPVTGTILSVTKSGRSRFQAIRMTVEFPNLSQTMIKEEFRFVDSRPEEYRYEEGKRVTILIDDTAKGGPVAKIAGGKTVIGKGFLLLSAILLSGAFYGSWYLYKVTQLRIENDWSRVDELFMTDGPMPLMGIIFIGVLIFQWLVFRGIQKMGSSRKKINDRELKYYGEKALATINRYEDTNVTINDNPKVRFHYSFFDRNGRSHTSEDTVIVGKLQIGLLPTMKEKEVFYLPQSPENSKFTENLTPQSFVGCLNGVLILQALIFSTILIVIYLAGVL